MRASFDAKTILFRDFLLSLLGFLFRASYLSLSIHNFALEVHRSDQFFSFWLSFLKQDSKRVLPLSLPDFFFGSKAHSLPVKPFGCLFSRVGICCCRVLTFSFLAVPLSRASLAPYSAFRAVGFSSASRLHESSRPISIFFLSVRSYPLLRLFMEAALKELTEGPKLQGEEKVIIWSLSMQGQPEQEKLQHFSFQHDTPTNELRFQISMSNDRR